LAEIDLVHFNVVTPCPVYLVMYSAI